MSLTSQNLNLTRVPAKLGRRLQRLFCLEGMPRTLGELADLVRERWSENLRNPRVKAHFQAIYSGSEVFGNVSYKTPHRVMTAGGKEVYTACALDAIIEGFSNQ